MIVISKDHSSGWGLFAREPVGEVMSHLLGFDEARKDRRIVEPHPAQNESCAIILGLGGGFELRPAETGYSM